MVPRYAGDAFVANVKISNNNAKIYTNPYLGGEYELEEPEPTEPPVHERDEEIPVINGENGTVKGVAIQVASAGSKTS